MKTFKILLTLILLIISATLACAQPRGCYRHYGSYGCYCPPPPPHYYHGGYYGPRYGCGHYGGLGVIADFVSLGLQGAATIANITQTERVIRAIEQTPVQQNTFIPQTVNTENVNIKANNITVVPVNQTPPAKKDTIILNGKRYISIE